MKTYSAKPSDVEKKWYVIDAKDVVRGRMASIIAMRLRGEHKPLFPPHIDCGDNIIVVNADKVRLTGRKTEDKIYYRHSGYPGGIKSRTAGGILAGRLDVVDDRPLVIGLEELDVGLQLHGFLPDERFDVRQRLHAV